MTPPEASTLAVAALNAGAAQLAKGRVLRDASAYGGEIVARGIAHWKRGDWADWKSAVDEDMRRLDGKGWRPGEPDIEAVMALLVHGGGDAVPLVPVWTRTILGHKLGDHPSSGCSPCRFAANGHGLMLIRACERNERTLRNLYDAMVLGGFISPLPSAEPKPIVDVERASEGLFAPRVRTQLEDF
jgi:hypothetical protein